MLYFQRKSFVAFTGSLVVDCLSDEREDVIRREDVIQREDVIRQTF